MNKNEIQFGYPNRENPITVESMSVTYIQEQDDADNSNEEIQQLTINTADGGAGIYYVLETKRWAIDGIDDIVDLLKDFESRLKFKG